MPDRDSILLEMVSTSGLLPNRWWVKWEIRSRYLSSGSAPNTDIMRNYADKAKPVAVRIQRIRLGYKE